MFVVKQASAKRGFEKYKESTKQKKGKHNTRLDTETQPVFVTSDSFPEARVSSLPRTGEGLKLPDWQDNQTEKDLEQIQMFIKEVVDKIRLSVVVRLNRRFWDDTDNVTEKVKNQTIHGDDSPVPNQHTRAATVE
jgi:hypothetical protein